uniref:phosphoenolpyruvate carboxylase n=2 Tax=Dunaliella tertiolecta TaxID=3047 RepID=A0A7S3VSI5_DUNTE|mmetsp:Transcript_14827/g.39965  ORF Transcript_14827/g.39965 Transcript_14827/m.39965 type:complete len:1096 (-) Transcript_14827:626-3913(-)|eukprot:CAMPEP_0202350644 /NCGR_PEP_ID=MMETSP1126-20121109/7631_1 /ASSEMBLY_ACC=CAM_ASM_000457 /TAXON_ID=3047 /ORGANISM="Dunaliella tertiolecta, Strain CCMP1320" /LENGTH=1095 /DNA_ID=CAMNT_0048942651 /DNA_START=95 /DNA_END=3382 /DNA_ORIENTATION=+
MGDAGEDMHHADDFNLQPLEDDCKLLGTILDDALTLEVGQEGFNRLNKIRAMAHAASMLERSGDSEGALQIQGRMREELRAMPIEEALPLVRAFGHYLNLSGIAELQHRLRRNRVEGRKSSKSCDEAFGKLLTQGVTPEQLYDAVTTQAVEVVLTAHPTQINRRTLQYKHQRIAAMLNLNDRPDLTKEERDTMIDDLVREVTSLWQTDELRRQKPTPLDEAQGGLHIVEQSLWNAVPSYMRRMSSALKKHTGRDLPLSATPFRFGSWMGGDRDGNPNVTAQVTHHVVCLARWMAADMYLREVDALRFELSMSSCSPEVWRMAKRIIRTHQQQMRRDAASPSETNVLVSREGGGNTRLGTKENLTPLVMRGSGATNPSRERQPPSLRSAGYVRPNVGYANQVDGMPDVPNLLPGQEGDGGSDCDLELDMPDGGSQEDLRRLREGSMNGDVPAQKDETEDVPPLVTPSKTLDNSAAGLTDPMLLRRSLKTQRAAADTATFRRVHDHPGFHPYRVILGDVRQKLMNTRKRMEDLLAHVEPSADDQWYEDQEDLLKPLRAVYWSLYECGSGIVADGRVLDFIRRVSCFGMSLMKLDIRQESTRHTEAMEAITTYLGYGSYEQWDEEQRINWLVSELQGRRPLIPPDMPMTDDVREVLDTCRTVARLGAGCLGAYVISMAKRASDVLAVELLQREANFQVAAERGMTPDLNRTLRVVPLFETLDDLDNAGGVMRRLLNLPWYRDHMTTAHGNAQEVMLGYSDSGKDAGRLSANWALYRCQEQLVAITREANIKLTLFHGRGGTVGRGGGPTYLAIQSQPPGSVGSSFRITEQGEMVQAKFGNSGVAQYQLEIYTTAVLQASIRPPNPPKHQRWRDLMDKLAVDSCEAYRSVVYKNPKFISYFKHATPEAELGNLNIGSRPARRRADTAGINELRAIPWQFAWTQTRLVLPAWLGIGEAVLKAIAQGHKSDLRAMYEEWPFFAATIDLIEMILAKSDARIAALYEDVLVEDADERKLGAELRKRLGDTIRAVLEVSGHKQLLEHNPTLRKLVGMRTPYIDPINILQVEVLRRLRQDPNNQRLRDALLVSINGIAAGMRNTG